MFNSSTVNFNNTYNSAFKTGDIFCCFLFVSDAGNERRSSFSALTCAEPEVDDLKGGGLLENSHVAAPSAFTWHAPAGGTGTS